MNECKADKFIVVGRDGGLSRPHAVPFLVTFDVDFDDGEKSIFVLDVGRVMFGTESAVIVFDELDGYGWLFAAADWSRAVMIDLTHLWNHEKA